MRIIIAIAVRRYSGHIIYNFKQIKQTQYYYKYN